jgi:hypothetical protein
MVKEIDASALSYLSITWNSIFWIWVAFLFVLSRTFFYVWRIRSLCDGNLSWMATLRIILLWEFTSAISPSTVGGTALASCCFLTRRVFGGKKRLVRGSANLLP